MCVALQLLRVGRPIDEEGLFAFGLLLHVPPGLYRQQASTSPHLLLDGPGDLIDGLFFEVFLPRVPDIVGRRQLGPYSKVRSGIVSRRASGVKGSRVEVWISREGQHLDIATRCYEQARFPELLRPAGAQRPGRAVEAFASLAATSDEGALLEKPWLRDKAESRSASPLLRFSASPLLRSEIPRGRCPSLLDKPLASERVEF